LRRASIVSSTVKRTVVSSELFAWLRSGKIKVHLSRTYPLRDAARAHADLATRKMTGKLLLEVD